MSTTSPTGIKDLQKGFRAIMFFILVLLVQQALSCPGIFSIRQEGPQIGRLHIYENGKVYLNENHVDDLGSCVDHLETISSGDILYIVNGTLFRRSLGNPSEELDRNVSTVTYDRQTSTIYWVKEGAVYFQSSESSGEIHGSHEYFYTIGYVISVAICLTVVLYRKRK